MLRWNATINEYVSFLVHWSVLSATRRLAGCYFANTCMQMYTLFFVHMYYGADRSQETLPGWVIDCERWGLSQDPICCDYPSPHTAPMQLQATIPHLVLHPFCHLFQLKSPLWISFCFDEKGEQRNTSHHALVSVCVCRAWGNRSHLSDKYRVLLGEMDGTHSSIQKP